MDEVCAELDDVFDLISDADGLIWEAIVLIRHCDSDYIKTLVEPLTKVRDRLYSETMKPIYEKCPEIAVSVGAVIRE